MTSSATEANNLCIKGVFFKELHAHPTALAAHSASHHTALAAHSATPTKTIIVSEIEHPSVLESVEYLKKYYGANVGYIPVDSGGVVRLSALETLLAEAGKDALLVCVQAVNNETGVIQPIEEAGEIAHKYGALFATDAVQAIGHIPVALSKNIDFIVASTHKIGGLVGTGCLVAKDPSCLEPLLHGGAQEEGVRSGTQDVPGAVAFASALCEAHKDMRKREQTLQALAKPIYEFIDAASNVHINGIPPKTPNIINFSVEGVDSDYLLYKLDERTERFPSISVSIGSACHAGVIGKSHVLEAMGADEKTLSSSIRVSLSTNNTLEEIRIFCDKLQWVIEG
jgi:cysteine desulfurase